MPSQAPTTFASAAAASNGVGEGGTLARNSGGSGDWSRPRMNGTQTFRRPSQVNTTSHQREASQQNVPATNSGVYVPPHMNSNFQPSFNRNVSTLECRYSKDQLLGIFRTYSEAQHVARDSSDIFTEGWVPAQSGVTSNGGWSRREEAKDVASGPEVCWEEDGSVHPLGLIDMDDEEKELFSSSVNSLAKPPPQNTNKEGIQTPGVNGRKASISQGQASGLASSSGRPGPRRRETSESLNPGAVASSTAFNRLPKDENPLATPPPSLLRRRTDIKDGAAASTIGDRTKIMDAGLDSGSPFGPFKRVVSGPFSASINGPTSPWSAAPPSAGFGQMGAFGSFSVDYGTGQPPTPGEKKPGLGSLRGESRFSKELRSKEGTEDTPRAKDKGSLSSLQRLQETDVEHPASRWGSSRASRPGIPEPSFFSDPEQRVGSAALGGDEPAPPLLNSFNPLLEQQRAHEGTGFSSFNDNNEISTPFREGTQRWENSRQGTPYGHQQPNANFHEPMSPTNTNPYQSPEAERSSRNGNDTDDSETTARNQQVYGQPSRAVNTSLEPLLDDRSRNSSTGPSRGLSGLGGLGSLSGLGGTGGWPTAPGTFGNSSRTNAAFSSGFVDSIFGSLGDLNAAGGNVFGAPSAINGGNIGITTRGSKLGSLFPTAMQEQMRSAESTRQDHGFNGLGAQGFGAPVRETDSPSHHGRAVLDDLFGNLDTRGKGLVPASSPFSTGETGYSHAITLPTTQTAFSNAPIGTPSTTTSAKGSFFGRSPEVEAASQIPATQQRQMVMPDRMRWIYRDPQGNTQGPWSGLEMHDWYKAGFFSPELQVKKLEDSDYEPLAQLIRRIGNSREPFLVPQIGIPHGSVTAPSTSTGAGLGNLTATSSSMPSGTAQPPFAGSFPSFGTTLTAEQQNALERRKQEEQYLMARQKEALAAQQVMMKQQYMQGGPHAMQLQHQSSVHSLQSQPSYGSITSPVYQHSPAHGPLQQPNPMQSFFDMTARQGFGGPGLGADVAHPVRENEMAAAFDRLNFNRAPQPSYGLQSGIQQEGMAHSQKVAAMLADRARLQREQEQFDNLERGQAGENRESLDRYEHFQQLRAHDQDPTQKDAIGRPSTGASAEETRPIAKENTAVEGRDTEGKQSRPATSNTETLRSKEPSSAPMPAQDVSLAHSPWTAIDKSVLQSLPPPQSNSPLPAPAAQRKRANVADALVSESRSQSPTPLAETTSAALAPWAKETHEGLKGPSLKEIQETEARRTAQQEEIAAAARRSLAEQERLVLAQAPAPAPGLPSTSTWAAGGSPVAAGASAWAKPLAGKAPVATPATKKTLAQIQKEEEARKSRAATAAASTVASTIVGTAVVPGGKRYSDLASKVAVATGPTIGGAWTTVGAGGKARTPAGLTPAPAAQKAAGGSAVPSVPAAQKAKPSAPGRSTNGVATANEELLRWGKSALGKGLNSGINADEFIRSLTQLPADLEIISEAIYGVSDTLDGRRLADEFIRRRKLAEKGVVPEASSAMNFSIAGAEPKGSTGGWSEVAKKGPATAAKEEASSTFKIVATKKKGKR